MAVSAGEIEALLKLRDDMSAALQKNLSVLARFDKALGVTEKNVKKMEGSLSKTAVAIGVFAGNMATRGVAAILDFGKEAVMTAVRLESLVTVSRFLGTQAGYTSEQVDALSAALNKQGITMSESRNTVISMVRANLDLSKAQQLANVAQSAARLSGQNSSETLSRLLHGIQTLQPEVLRYAGIIVNLELEYSKWAKANDRTIMSLTGAEKQTIALNAVLKQGTQIAGVYAVTNQDVSGRLQSLRRHIEDAGASMGKAFIPAVRLAVDAATTFFKAVRESPEMFRNMGIAVIAAGTALSVSWAVPAALALVSLNLLIAAFTGTVDPIENSKSALRALGDTLAWLAGFYKTITAGVVDFNAVFENANMIGLALSTTWLSLGNVAALLAIGILKVARAMAMTNPFTDELTKEIDLQLRLVEEWRGSLADAANENVANFDKAGKKVAQSGKDQNAVLAGLAEAARKIQEKLAKEAAATAGDAADKKALKAKLDFNDKMTDIIAKSLEYHADLRAKDLDNQLMWADRSAQIHQGMFDKMPQRNVGSLAVGIGQLAGGITPTTISNAGKTFGSLLGKTLSESFKGSMKGMPDAILGAIQGGGDVGKTIGAKLLGDVGTNVGGMLAKAIGGKLGGAIGGIMGPIGSLVGAKLGELGGKLVGKLFGSEEKKVNDMRDALMKAAGGYDVLAAHAAEAGVSIKAVLDAKTVEEYEKAVKAMDIALQVASERMKFIEAQGGLELLKAKAIQARVPLEKLFDAKNAKDLKLAIDDISKALGTWEASQEAVDAAMQKYGITVDQLGLKHSQMRLDKEGGSLLMDYKILEAAGVDLILLSDRMGEGFSDYVNRVIAAGGTIPEAMRPVIEKMIENGDLLDANGEAFESVEESGIKFAKTTSEMFDLLLVKIDQFVNALMGITPPTINVPVNFDTGNGPPLPGDDGHPGFASGSGGWRNFGKGTWRLMHGEEAVIRKGQKAPAGGDPNSNLVRLPRQAYGDVHLHIGSVGSDVSPAALRQLTNSVTDAIRRGTPAGQDFVRALKEKRG